MCLTSKLFLWFDSQPRVVYGLLFVGLILHGLQGVGRIRAGCERKWKFPNLAEPHNGEVDGVTGLVGGHLRVEAVVIHAPAISRVDHVAAIEAGILGGAG